jgi:hypothetical protein
VTGERDYEGRERREERKRANDAMMYQDPMAMLREQIAGTDDQH